MDFIIANVEHIEFKIERDLNEQYGSLPLPFPGMDSKYKTIFIFRFEFMLWMCISRRRDTVYVSLV